MSMTDPIADMLTRIRNGSKSKFEKVDIPSSKMKREIARILKEEGFIKNFKGVTEDHREVIRIFLKYDENRKGSFTSNGSAGPDGGSMSNQYHSVGHERIGTFSPFYPQGNSDG